MHLNEALPRWDRRERHEVLCDAPPAAVMRAAETVTWREAPIFYGLMAMMSLGRPRFSADQPVLDMFVGSGFSVLVRTEDEIVVGGIERFSRKRPVIGLERPDLASFRNFDEPGCVKIGFNFRFTDGKLTTETRVKATDARSRRLFGLYWIVIRPGSGLIRHVWLRAIRRRTHLFHSQSLTRCNPA